MEIISPGATAFVELSDVPVYSIAQALKNLKVNSGGTGIMYQTAPVATAIVYGEVLTGTIDGVNTVFTIAHTPSSGQGITSNGIRQQVGVDYSIVTSTITMTLAPQIGDILLADYTY